jgi:hypothetical protein
MTTGKQKAAALMRVRDDGERKIVSDIRLSLNRWMNLQA